ncbi:hypothetical protein [Kribbella jiaozuonensis]|uniref:Uncharacterized protein n=1 Tax=Kribbella jiaozuonensis TaxID=2575441 RepID=A0A4U3M1K6_9ACTN|nr:hypothetical protein [Kribbella jiaozuonensis]TKK82200.1 hypothetical protein FDA38_05150 [Kribbella jiaozuonensis]
MADAQVGDLIRSINRLVERDTGSWSLAVGNQIAQRVTRSDQRRLRLLVDNLDIPARLAPRPGEADQRAGIRDALVETVASCAGVLEPREPAPESLYSYGQSRFEAANSRLYAQYETPRLVAELRPDGRPDDLGIFPPPRIEGDVLAAHAAVVAISARTGRPERVVLRELVAAGRGAHATAAARMLLQSRPGFTALPASERNDLTTRIADDLEAQFENHEREAPGPEIGAVLADRQQLAGFGSTAITTASQDANEEIAHLHQYFDTIGWPPAVARPDSVAELCGQIQGAVGEVLDAPNSRWDGGIESGGGAATTLKLPREQAVALGKLLESSRTHPLDASDATAAREAFQFVAAEYARWAVPEEFDERHEAAVGAVAAEYATIEQAVGTAFAEDNLRDLADRSLPYELAIQVRQARAPEPDGRLAPAARSFAAVIDKAVGAEEGVTLRRMAGESAPRMVQAAVGDLVAGSGVQAVERPFALSRITDEVDLQFAALPGVLDNALYDDSAPEYGTLVGEVAVKMSETYAEAPGMARRESLAREQESAARFASGHDPALTRPQAQAPAASQTTARTTSNADPKRPTLDR